MASSPLRVAVGGLFVGFVLVVRVLLPADWDPSALASFGLEAEQTLEYAEARLGNVAARSFQGHDGKFFFVQANDPLLLHPTDHASALDRPAYRSQRMLYPLLAGLGGLLPPDSVLWGLAVVNLIGMGAGAGLLAAYARRFGLSPWLGLAFPLNPGMIHELTVDGAGVLAFCLVSAAVVAVKGERMGLSVALLVMAALTREVMLVAALGIAIWLWLGGKKKAAWWHAGIPPLFVLSWAAYVRLRLPNQQPAEIQEVGLPFAGLLEAARTWIQEPAYLVVGLVVLICMALLILQMARGRSDPLAYVAGGFVALSILLTAQVWRAEFDITRAIAPVLTAVIVNPLFSTRSTPVNSTLEA